MTAVMGLRERKKAETRLAIATAALALAEAHGPDGVTVDDIAAHAGVSPRTVFNYFATKDEAILGIDPEAREAVRAAIVDRPAHEAPVDAVGAVLVERVADPAFGRRWRTRARLVREHPQLHMARASSLRAYEDLIAEAVAARTNLDPSRHVYPRLVAAATLSALRVVVDLTADEQDPARLRAALLDAFAVLTAGFPPPPRPSRPSAPRSRRP